MYKICKTESAAQRQRMLELCLLKEMAEQPFSQITISGLCRYAGVPRKAFYRYFKNLDDALLALVDHTMEACNREIMNAWDGSSQLTQRTLEAYFSYWVDNKNFVDIMIRQDLWHLVIMSATAYVDRRKAENHSQVKSADYANELAEYFVSHGLMMTIMHWCYHGCPSTPKEMAKAFCEMLNMPLASRSRLF